MDVSGWRVGAKTHVGLVRDGNEDAFYAGARLLVVADGVGGSVAGEIASKLAVNALIPLDTDPAITDPREALRAAIHDADLQLRDAIAREPKLAGMGTTSDAFTVAGLGAFALIFVVAVTGKIAGGGLGAKLSGYSTRDSLAVGSLMNARGMIELIVMKVGLDAGLIGPELFTLLLLLAMGTTLMTGPLLGLLARGSAAYQAGTAGNAGK